MFHWNQPILLGTRTKVSFPKWPRDGSRDARLDHEYFDLCRRVPLVFTRSCNDRHILHFPPTTWLNNCFTVLFNRPLSSFRQPHHSVFPKYCYLLKQGTLPGAFSGLPGNGNLSPLREIQKARTKQPCTVVMSAEYCGQITTGSQAGNTLAWSPKGNKTLTSSRSFRIFWRQTASSPWSGAFSWSDREPYLLQVTHRFSANIFY